MFVLKAVTSLMNSQPAKLVTVSLITAAPCTCSLCIEQWLTIKQRFWHLL